MRKFSADYIFTLEGNPIENGVIVTDDEGKILAVSADKPLFDPSIESFKGIIVPGFVNAHCHLELSHLHQKIPKGEGLIPFIKNVIFSRTEEEEIIISAMEKADEYMYQNGIVAVGDISNQSISSSVKNKSKIKYHTFVEMLGLNPDKSKEILENAIELKKEFSGSVSLAPHASYSTSKKLIRDLAKYSKDKTNIITIHNQECEAENFLFRFKDGPFMQFYKDMNIDTHSFSATCRDSLQSYLPFMPKNQHILLVHNTFTNYKNVFFTERFNLELFWCFCPNANLYIENRLPNFDFFKKTEYPITVGTDSLASNDQLSILEELKIIQENAPDLGLSTLLNWACINGAKFLNFEEELGSISVGKTPGINLINNMDGLKLTAKSRVKKLI